MKLIAQLVWGTNDEKSPDSNHKPVDEATLKKLQDLPLKWKSYFEVKRQDLEIPVNESRNTQLNKCELKIKYLGDSKIEITPYGNGKELQTRLHKLPKGETLILGGNAENKTGSDAKHYLDSP